MIALPIPDCSVLDAIRACAERMQDDDLATRLVAASALFASAEKVYRQRAQDRQLFTFEPSETAAGVISVDEMKWLYKNRFSKLGSPCRPLYDQIRVKAKICPLCNSRTVSTLDHYLAQTHHPDFVLTPINLVPACGDCNKEKLAADPKTIDEQTLHPYFDSLPVDAPWLVAEVIEDRPFGIVFNAAPPVHWNQDLSNRLRQHFKAFSLGDLYSAKASSEVAEIASLIEVEHALNGAQGLRDYLRSQAGGRRSASPHSWKAALYQGLADSQWFVDGGFRNIKV